jgi:hypothetical protein
MIVERRTTHPIVRLRPLPAHRSLRTVLPVERRKSLGDNMGCTRLMLKSAPEIVEDDCVLRVSGRGEPSQDWPNSKHQTCRRSLCETTFISDPVIRYIFHALVFHTEIQSGSTTLDTMLVDEYFENIKAPGNAAGIRTDSRRLE